MGQTGSGKFVQSQKAAGSGEPAVLTIRQAAERFGVTMRALRFYEARGLLRSSRAQPATGTTRNSVRLYDGDQIRQLQRILKAKAMGFTLTQTRNLLETAARDSSPADLPLGRRDAAARIARLEFQRDTLDRTIAELKAVWMPEAARPQVELRAAG